MSLRNSSFVMVPRVLIVASVFVGPPIAWAGGDELHCESNDGTLLIVGSLWTGDQRQRRRDQTRLAR